MSLFDPYDLDNILLSNRIGMAPMTSARNPDKILMLAGGMTKARATDLIGRGVIDLAAFGQLYISNPDLVDRLRRDTALATPDRGSYYGGDVHGHTDYPAVTS